MKTSKCITETIKIKRILIQMNIKLQVVKDVRSFKFWKTNFTIKGSYTQAIAIYLKIK